MGIKKELFADLNSKKIYSYTLQNQQGMKIKCIDYGCIITSIMVPDVQGNFENVVLGFDTLDEYQKYSPYFGAICGRVAGRISGGEFQLNEKKYQLEKDNGNHHLHGGLVGFDKVIWDSKAVETKDELSVVFSRLSMDGEEGYPGNLKMEVMYTLTNNNELIVTYEGETDQTTIVNVTNHTYFNLSGNTKFDILNHRLQLKSEQFLELNSESIPTGNSLSVAGTPFDFLSGRKIIDGVTSVHPQNQIAGAGYDHPFILKENNNGEILLTEEESRRSLTIETDQPCVVLYTGNHLQDDFKIGDVQSKRYLGLCLETQGFPDAINQSLFPSIVLEKDKRFFSQTKYAFGIS